jgi:probable rRNA maturation factor
MKLSQINKEKSIDPELLEKVAEAAFSCLKKTEGEIELKFVPKEEIQDLNMTYRGIDKETDVLSFTISEQPLIGQIFICYNVAKEQAKELEKDLPEEIALLLVHGILHVYGFDHIKDSEAEEMQSFETEILSKVGVNR